MCVARGSHRHHIFPFFRLRKMKIYGFCVRCVLRKISTEKTSEKYGNASKLEAGQQLSWLTSSQLAQEAQVQTNNDNRIESNIYGHLTRAHRDNQTRTVPSLSIPGNFSHQFTLSPLPSLHTRNHFFKSVNRSPKARCCQERLYTQFHQWLSWEESLQCSGSSCGNMFSSLIHLSEISSI